MPSHRESAEFVVRKELAKNFDCQPPCANCDTQAAAIVAELVHAGLIATQPIRRLIMAERVAEGVDAYLREAESEVNISGETSRRYECRRIRDLIAAAGGDLEVFKSHAL